MGRKEELARSLDDFYTLISGFDSDNTSAHVRPVFAFTLTCLDQGMRRIVGLMLERPTAL